MRKTTSEGVVLLFAMALSAAPGAAQEEHDHPHPAAGDVRFPVSCEPAVQPAFERAVAMLHSFGYEEARRAFRTVAEADPGCGMAHWGEAMTWYHPLWAAPTPAELAAGQAAAERAERIGAPTARERAYIEAIGAFYQGAPSRDHASGARAYRAAMEEIASVYEDDDEADIFHALAMLGAATPGDTGFADQKRAADILRRLLPKYPRHPGIAHYTIHAFDYPQLAELALPAARIYADIAPESPHAQHMPTHIFTRLGLWDESIASNLACVGSAEAAVGRTHPGSVSFEALHCQDYLAYAYLQLGDDARARRILDGVMAARRIDDANVAAGYALLAVPARYALERRDWRTAASLERPAVVLEWDLMPYAQGVTLFAHAAGAARIGELGRAREAVEGLERLHQALVQRPPGGPYDWVGWVETQGLAARAWLAFAEGRGDEAVRLLTSATDKDDVVGKHPVTPGDVLPVRELLGDLLFEVGRPRQALDAYEAALARSPRRFNGLLGAARAARALGERERAAGYYRALVDQVVPETTRVSELAEAREYLEEAGVGGGPG
jgi:Tfp pilus assembly protein PilF